MSPFDWNASIERARKRFGRESGSPTRAPRSDRGRPRLAPAVVACVSRVLSGRDRPPMREMLARISRECRVAGHTPPSRATVYKLMKSLPGPKLRVGDLSAAVRSALYNLEPDSEVPAHQVAFYGFNYGDLQAMSFAAGLPWLAIYQALRMPGYRRKSRGLVRAVARARRI